MKTKGILLVLLATVATCSAGSQPSFQVEPNDVASVKIAFSRDYPPLLEIHLRYEKTEQLTAFTTSNQFKTVAILIQKEKISEPQVRQPVTNGVLEVYVPDSTIAVRLATTLMKQEEAPPNKAPATR